MGFVGEDGGEDVVEGELWVRGERCGGVRYIAGFAPGVVDVAYFEAGEEVARGEVLVTTVYIYIFFLVYRMNEDTG